MENSVYSEASLLAGSGFSLNYMHVRPIAIRGFRWAVAIFCLMVLVLVRPAWAEEARLTDVVVAPSREHLIAYLRVTNCFTEEMNKAIENGIKATFTFFVRLYEVRDLQWDRKIADIQVRHDIQYDSLKKVFRVRQSEKNNKTIFLKDFEKAKKIMSMVSGLKVIELSRLRKGARYQVQMMAELDKIKLPYYLHYVFFFISLWNFETDWYAVNFRY